MLHEQLSKNLKEGETLVKMVRRDILASIGPLSLAVLLVLADFFLLTFFVHRGPWGILGFTVVLFVGVVVGVRALVEWQLNALLVTNERVVHVFQKGFFNRMVAETTYDKVTDVRSTIKGMAQTILGIGSIEVQTAGEGENLRIDGVRQPAQVQALLTNILRSSHAETDIPLSAQELVAALTKAKNELGTKGFNEVLGRVAAREDRARAQKEE